MGTAPKAPKTSEAPPLAVKIGDVVLDRYRVLEQIASGGHSVVFLGQDERLARPVCIKVFSGLGGNSGVGRTSYEHFVQEAFALSRLTHPNTLRIYDFGHLGPKDAAGMPLQVCEYMNGGTLAHIIREQGRQSLAETVRVVTAMCLSLGEAHALGIVHRDIKPQNILFGTVGINKLPKLADFGIAKWSADDDKKQQRAEDTAIVAGQKLAMYSPSWAAPEQLAGQPVSPATDIYSLACVAVYMLSGKAIFADEDVYAGYKKRRHAEELVEGALAPLGVPVSAIRVLSKALAFDPKKRLLKVEDLAGEMASALEPATDQPFHLPPGVPVPPPPRLHGAGPNHAAATAPLAGHAGPPAIAVQNHFPQSNGAYPSAAQPSGVQPSGAQPSGGQPSGAQPSGAQPGGAPPSGAQGSAGPAVHGNPMHAGHSQVAHNPAQNAAAQNPDAQQLAQSHAAPSSAVPGEPTPPPHTSYPTTQPPLVQSWTPPPTVQPWMVGTSPSQGMPRRLLLSDLPQIVGDRRAHFIQAAHSVADLVGKQQTKVRVTFLSGPSGARVLHLKGLTCFVAHLGGRPSPAVQLDHASDIALVTPRAQEIGHIRCATGTPGLGQTVFPVGAELVAIAFDDCMDVILFDFGPGSEAYFVYTRGRSIPKSRRG